MKPKVILDIAILGLGFDRKSGRRGVERQVDHLFENLLKSDFFDASFVATASLAGAYDFLRASGIEPEAKLKFCPRQLSSSRLARQLTREIQRTIEDRSLRARSFRKMRALAANWLGKGAADIREDFLPDAGIYHTPHTNHPLMPFPPAVQKHRRIKKFITIHDLWLYTKPRLYKFNQLPGQDPYFKRMLNGLSETTFAFCTSQSVRADVLEWTRLRPERIFMAPPAADPGLFSPVNDPQIRAAALQDLGISDSPYFLALSVSEAHKNFGHLIRCFGELVQSGELPDYNLVIVGRHAARHPLVTGALAQYPRLAGRVLTPGFVPDEKLAAIYSGAAAFLFPSLAEGFGLPPLEAMQCGVPVICSDATAIPEVVGDAGILLPPTDVDGWCQAMLKVSRDEKLRMEMAAKSIERAKFFSWEKYNEDVTRGYKAGLEFED